MGWHSIQTIIFMHLSDARILATKILFVRFLAEMDSSFPQRQDEQRQEHAGLTLFLFNGYFTHS